MTENFSRGYIYKGSEKFTFCYENGILTLVSFNENSKPSDDYFGKPENIKYFEGYTLYHHYIAFYIDNNVRRYNGSYRCRPRCVILSKVQGLDFSDYNFGSVCIEGGIISSFYSNHRIISFDDVWKQKYDFISKSREETISRESVDLNGINTEFELSISPFVWMYNDFNAPCKTGNSFLEVKYPNGRNYKEIIEDLIKIKDFFDFCANLKNYCFDNISLLKIDNTGNKSKIADIIIPSMPKTDDEGLYVLNYDLFSGKLNKVFEFFNKSKYIFSTISEDNVARNRFDNHKLCAVISCFQSIRRIVYKNIDKEIKTKDEIALDEVKQDVLPILETVLANYTGRKRKCLRSFINMIEKSDFNLEKSACMEFRANGYLLEVLHPDVKKAIEKKGIEDSINYVIKKRDCITHEDIVDLDDILEGVYQIIYRLNYIMILTYAGIDKSKIKAIIFKLAGKSL